MVNLSVEIAGVKLKNPVMPASGTFGSGMMYSQFIDLSKLGAVVVKGVSLAPWDGNPACRVAEATSGMLNSIGLQNPGAEAFLDTDLPFLKRFGTKVIVNICGHSIEEYEAVAQRFKAEPVDMLELNISCPNVAQGGIAFGTDAKLVEKCVSAVKLKSRQPVIAKLSPNVTDITEIARAAEAGGADAISLVNTLLGMKIDIKKRAPVLGNAYGGLSGPAIMPVAVRMTHQVSRAVKLPIIGMGGIASAEDAVEFMMAGATAIAVGTANFKNPKVMIDIIKGIEDFMKETGVDDVNDFRKMLS
ncbi:MAG: dihydroorotate dehydrogenase [Clostridiales bacterium]|jgi:dihydroorotate dehydrogenase (NAD+) catalytic subunit|nr:dihydroorotate dehydrogenase [Clostridiales bacterium]